MDRDERPYETTSIRAALRYTAAFKLTVDRERLLGGWRGSLLRIGLTIAYFAKLIGIGESRLPPKL